MTTPVKQIVVPSKQREQLAAIRRNVLVACEHSSNLNIFQGIISLLEGGTITGVDQATAKLTAARIIVLCKAETIRQLTSYDAAISKMTGSAK